MPNQPVPLEKAAAQLRDKLAKNRADAGVSKQMERTAAKVLDLRIETDTAPSPAAYRGEFERFLAQIEREIEMLDGKVANLLDKHGVTPEIIEAGYDLLESARPEDFVREKTVEALEKGNVLELGMNGIGVFRILKVADTGASFEFSDPESGKVFRFERSICLVDLRFEGGKRGRRELLVTFPIREGELLVSHDPRTQEFLMKKEVLWARLNKKTVADKLLALMA